MWHRPLFIALALFIFSSQVQAGNECQNPHQKVSQFFQLVEEGDQTGLTRYLKGNTIAYDARNAFCESAFHVAIRNNDIELFDFLYEEFHEPDLNQLYGRILTRSEEKEHLKRVLRFAGGLYNYALIFGDSETINHVKDKGSDFNWAPYTAAYRVDSRKKVKAILLAHNQSRQGRILLFRHIRNSNVDINHRHQDEPKKTDSVFLSVASTVPTNRLEFIIETLNGDVNQVNNFGETPLFKASFASNLKMARENSKLLIKKGAKHSKDKDDETPLMHFARNGANEVIEQLAKRGEDMSYRPSNDVHSPIVWAIEADRLDSVEALVEWGASINHVEERDIDMSPSSRRPLDYAKSDEMKDLLSKFGAISEAN